VFEDDDDMLLLLGVVEVEVIVVVVVVLGICVGMTTKWKRGVEFDIFTAEDDEVCIFCFALVGLVVLFWRGKN